MTAAALAVATSNFIAVASDYGYAGVSPAAAASETLAYPYKAMK